MMCFDYLYFVSAIQVRYLLAVVALANSAFFLTTRQLKSTTPSARLGGSLEGISVGPIECGALVYNISGTHSSCPRMR